MRKTALLCLLSVFLVSCVGIDSRMTLRENGSGTLILTYRISQLVADLGVSTTGKAAIPLPVTRADFDRSLASSGGKVRLTRFDKSENAQDITVHAELAFDSVDALSSLDAFKDAELRYTSDGSSRILTQVIVRAPKEPLSEDTQRMMDALFDGYELSYTVEAPKPMQETTVGTLSADKRSLTYKASVKEIMMSKSDLVLSAKW